MLQGSKMLLRRTIVSQAAWPSRAVWRQRKAPLRFLCSAGPESDAESQNSVPAAGTRSTSGKVSDRFTAGKSILMELFPGSGKPEANDIHAARTLLYTSLRRWEAAEERTPEEIMHIMYALPSRYYPAFAQFVNDQRLLPKLSLEDVKGLVRNHPRHNSAPLPHARHNSAPLSLPLLNGCIERLTAEAENLSTVDAALVLISLSYIQNVDYGKLLGVLTSKILRDVESVPFSLIAAFTEMLSRKRLLDRRFSSGILGHIEQNADQLQLSDLLSCCKSFSFSRVLLTNHTLLKMLDARLVQEEEALTDAILGSSVKLFLFNNYRAKHSLKILKETLTDQDKEASCSHQTFALIANFLCLKAHVNDEDVLTAIRSGIVTRKTFEPKELMLLAAILSHLQLVSYNAPTSPLEDIVSVIEDHIPKLHASQLVSLLMEMKKVEVLSTRLVENVLNRALDTVEELKPDDAVRLIHSAARVLRKDKPDSAVKLMWKLAPQISVQVPHMQPKLLSMTCMAMNMLAVKHPLLCTNIAERGLKMLSSNSPDIMTLSSLASALSRVDFAAVDFFVELHKMLESDMLPMGSQQHMVRLVWACVAQGVVPRKTLKERVFTVSSAPTGDEELSYLQMLRDLFIISVYDGIFKVQFSQSKALQSLFASISAKQTRFESKPEFVTIASEILGEDSVVAGGLTVESISIPAAILFSSKDGSPVTWSSIGLQKDAILPQPRALKEKHSVRAVALVSPSVIHPEKSPSGQTKMMCRLLNYAGWEVGLVPAHQWNAQEDRSAKLDLLKEILMDTLTRPADSGPTKPDDDD